MAPPDAISVLAPHAVPEVELDALTRELHRALAAEARQDRVERLLLGHAGVEGLLAAEPGGDLQRLALVVAEAVEHADEEVTVGDRLAHLERRVPRGEHREVVLVEVGDGLGVVRLELAIRDLIDPRAHDLTDELAPRLAADRLGDDSYGVLGFDETERHRGWLLALGGAYDLRGPQAPRRTARPASVRVVVEGAAQRRKAALAVV